jgi:hypothetical protein
MATVAPSSLHNAVNQIPLTSQPSPFMAWAEEASNH